MCGSKRWSQMKNGFLPPAWEASQLHRGVDVHLGGGLLGRGVDLREALAETGAVVPQVAGGDQGEGVVAGSRELIGQRRLAPRQRRLEIVDAMVLAVEAGQDRGEARVGDVEGGVGVEPDVALPGQAVERRGRAGLPAPGAEGVGAQRVDADQQDVGPVPLARLLRGREILAAVDRGAPPEHAGNRLIRGVRGRAVDLQEQVDLAAGVGGEVDLHRRGGDGAHRLGVYLEELLEPVRRLADADPVGALAAVRGAQGDEGEVGVAPGLERPPHARAGPLLQGPHLPGGPLGEGDELLGRHQPHVPHLLGAEVGDPLERRLLPFERESIPRPAPPARDRSGPRLPPTPTPILERQRGEDQQAGEKEKGEAGVHGGGV